MRLRRQTIARGGKQTPHQLGRPKSEGLNPPAPPHEARQSYVRFRPGVEPSVHPNPDLVEEWEPAPAQSWFQRIRSWLVDRAD